MAATTKKRAAKLIEWIGGTVRLPTYVTGEGEPYRPVAALWLSRDSVMGMEILGRDYAPEQIVASFEATTRKPMKGRPHAPDRVRVASPDLAEALRAAVAPGTEVICAPTPELTEMMAALQEQMEEMTGGDAGATHFVPGITAEALASFFRTSARLYRAAPWKVVPGDGCLIGVTLESLGVRDAVVSILGRLGESYGFVCFSSRADYEELVDVSAVMANRGGGPLPKLPRQIALNFDRGADVPAPMRREIATHGWEVASAEAYPWLSAVDEDAIFRPPTAAELTRMEAIAGAIAWLVESERDLARAWERAEPLIRSTTVETGAGPVAVALAVLPDAFTPIPYDDEPFDIYGSIFDPLIGEVDGELFEDYRDELLDRFEESPEGEALTEGVDHSALVLDYAANHFGVTPVDITPSMLRQIVFDVIPAKLVCRPEIAGSIVEELRAFFAFLGREFELPNAEPCRAALGGDAAARLAKALSDPRKFGMGKSLMMSGLDAGFDVFSEEGVRAWMSEVQKRPLQAPPPKRDAAGHAKKNQRKAERKARRKNR
jgi:hypothetical protein